MTLALLLEASLRVLMIAAVVGGALWALRVRNPHVQLAAWRGVLLAALVMPFLMQSVTLTLPAQDLPAIALPESPPATDVFAEPPAAADTSVEAFLAEPAEIVTNLRAFDWELALLGLYGAVAGLLLLRLAVGAMLSWRLVRSAEPVTAQWCIGRAVRTSRALTAPVTIGSTILLPPDYDTWSAEKRRAVLSHESAHVARGDFYILLLAAIHRAVFWFNPLSWWLHDKLSELAELASDAEAVACDDARPSYATILLEFAAAPRSPIIAVAMARPQTIRRRIEFILREGAIPARLTGWMQAGIAVAMVPLALAAAVNLVRAPALAAPDVAAEALPIIPPVPVLLVPEISAPNPPIPSVLPEVLQRTAQRNVERALDQSLPVIRAAVSAENATETRALSTFRSVNFSSAGTVRITIGPLQSVTLVGDPNTLSDVKTAVRGDTLRISTTQHSSSSGSGRLVVNITVPHLDDVKFSGSGGLYLAGLNGGALEVDFSGSGSIDARGSLDSLDLKISGSGNAEMADLVVRDAELDISGSGRVTLQPRRNLDASLSGSGAIEAHGSVNKLNLEVSGSGKADMADLIVADAELDISGSADVTVQARNNLHVQISGSSTVNYIGNPKHMSTSGSGTFHRLDAN